MGDDLDRARHREAATREILEVISQSRNDDRPVFEVILHNAARLCKAPIASLILINMAGTHLVMAAMYGDALRTHSTGDAWPIDPPPGPVARSIRSARIVHMHDLAVTDEYRHGHPTYVQLVDDDGLRTDLSVPLVRDGVGFGAITLSRRAVDPFDDADIALVETFAAQAVIAIENVRQFRELEARLEREAATKNVLRVISESPDDEQPTFEAILDSATRLCGTQYASLVLGRKGDASQRMVAHRAAMPETLAVFSEGKVRMDPEDSIAARAILEGRTIHVPDMADTDQYRAGHERFRLVVDRQGLRSNLFVPLLGPEGGIGCFILWKKEVAPFTTDQIALAETFAAQAVIAIENVRQFRELQTRLKREAATREILEVISQSRDDDAPVFEVILRRAADLCGAHAAALVMGKAGDAHQQMAASDGVDPATVALYDSGAVPMDPDISFAARAILTGEVVHVEDMMDTARYRSGDGLVFATGRDSGIRTIMYVPLVSEAGGIGALNIFRREVRPYTADEIALVETFAAQAVIAIENVRQFRELQTRLKREAATREILEVISQSRDDDRPVFDAILRNAIRLCSAHTAALMLGRPVDARMALAAWRDVDDGPDANYDAMIAEMNATGPVMDPSVHLGARAICSGKAEQILDAAETDSYRRGEPTWRYIVDEMDTGTMLSVPLRDATGSIGAINLHRREIRLFAEDEIELVRSFAAQAVIAIENVRQFRELQTRLAREAATGEILGVISQSRDDDLPVFDTIVKNAQDLCDAPMCGLILVGPGDGLLSLAAHRNVSETTVEMFRSGAMRLDGTMSYTARSILERKIINLTDMAESELYKAGSPIVRVMVEEVGMRSVLFVPLMAGDVAIGALSLFRYQVFPFEERLVDLVRTFAAQAVIAIDNVRQFRELQTRLKREAATREILEVISQSRADDRPVFDAILRRAAHLCNASAAALVIAKAGDTHQRLAASYGLDPATIAFYDRGDVPMDPNSKLTARAILTGQIVHVEDLMDTEDYRRGNPTTCSVVQDSGIRTEIYVPLLTMTGAIGLLIVFRKEVKPYTADEIALIETFAAQAVIAIENVRQFKALEALNAELGDRVQAQVGEIERMGRLKRFLPAAVADTVISSGSEKMLTTHRALLGVLFCDMRGFTAFCETAEPEEIIEVLQTYHEEMGKLINAHGAGVDQRMGDGILVLFNDPLPCDDPAGEAVRLAVAMRARMTELCLQWKRLGHRLGFGVGISLGYATVGMVGYEGRFDYTASGTAINLASRLCDEALDGEILLSPRACIAVEDRVSVESRGAFTLKGIREPVEVFRLAGLAAV